MAQRIRFWPCSQPKPPNRYEHPGRGLRRSVRGLVAGADLCSDAAIQRKHHGRALVVINSSHDVDRTLPTHPMKSIPWCIVNWRLKTSTLRKKFGVSRQAIHKARKRHAAGEIPNVRRNYDATDWNLPDTIIAKRRGVSLSAVCRERKKRGIPRVIPVARKRNRGNNSSVNDDSETEIIDNPLAAPVKRGRGRGRPKMPPTTTIRVPVPIAEELRKGEAVIVEPGKIEVRPRP